MQCTRCRMSVMVTRRSFLGALAASVGAAGKVKVTDVESFNVRVPDGGTPDPLKLYRYAVTRVKTDAGVTGTSFVGCPPDILNRWVKPTLIGDNLFAIDRHLKRLQMERGESGVQIWSGVEHAMWDAIGKITERPVADLDRKSVV